MRVQKRDKLLNFAYSVRAALRDFLEWLSIATICAWAAAGALVLAVAVFWCAFGLLWILGSSVGAW